MRMEKWSLTGGADALNHLTVDTLNGTKPLKDHIAEHDLDAVLETKPNGTFMYFGEWVVNHQRHLEAGAAVALLAGGAATVIGVILHQRQREKKK